MKPTTVLLILFVVIAAVLACFSVMSAGQRAAQADVGQMQNYARKQFDGASPVEPIEFGSNLYFPVNGVSQLAVSIEKWKVNNPRYHVEAIVEDHRVNTIVGYLVSTDKPVFGTTAHP